jgi:drug/metabolite transporter (DMT)-like permease
MIAEAAMLAAYAIASTAAVLTAKRAVTAPRLLPAVRILGVGAMLYVAALALLLALLRAGDASTMFPAAIGGSMLATTAAGVHLHRERLTVRRLSGTLLVIAGIALLLAGGMPAA